MSAAGTIQAAIEKHKPSGWTSNDAETYAEELAFECDDSLDFDANLFAHVCWTQGALWPHDGECFYRDHGGDADYENRCDGCREAMEELGRKVLAEVAE